MNCTKCGKEIPDGENKLCEECKNSLLTDLGNEEDNKFEIKKEQNPKKEKAPKKKCKKGFIATIIFLIVAITVIVLEFTTGMLSDLVFKTNTVGIDIGNNNNMGFATIQGEWIYYMSLSENGMEIALNKVKTDGTENQVLVQKDWEIYSINVVGNYLYFIAYEPTEDNEKLEETSTPTAYRHNKIYKLSTDGKELTVINDGHFSPESMSIYVVKDRIYYVGENYNVYSMDTYGGDRTIVSDKEAGFIGITDKYILYNDYPENPKDETDFVTYIMNLDGTNARLINGKRLYNPNIIGDTIYYVNSENTAIYKVNIDGTGDEKVYDSKAYNMNVNGEYIYYLNYKEITEGYTDDRLCINKVKVDGTGHEVILELENYTKFINILGDWIFYTDHADNVYYINLTKTDGSETLNLYKCDFNG